MTKPKKIRDEHLSTLSDGIYNLDGMEYVVQGGMRQWKAKVIIQGVGRKTRQLGVLADLPTIADARKMLDNARNLGKQGIDIAVEQRRNAARKAKVPTFGEHATTFMDGYLPTLKNKSSTAKWRGSMKNHCKHLWGIRVDLVETSDILIDLKPIWKTIGPTAAEVRRRIETVLDDAKNQGYRTGDNPAVLTLALQRSLGGRPPASGATRGSHKSVPFNKIPTLVIELQQRRCQTARALMAITLSCVRSQEFTQMQYRELDLDAEQPTWTIPWSRFKVDPHKQDYVVPLSPQLVAVLREQIFELEEIYGIGNVDYIWPSSTMGTRNNAGPANPWISDATMLRYLQKSMGYDATVHGFRASFETWCDDQFADGSDTTPRYHEHAVEFVLAHVAPGGKTKKAYRRGMMFQARIPIMREWADYCAPPSTTSINSSDNIFTLRQTA